MSNDYFKAQGWFKNYARSSEDSRGVFQQLVKEDEEAFRLASAETDKIKAMINKKFGSGSIKYGSEISQPPARPDVIQMDAINAFIKRNPAAEGGRMRFDKGLSAKQKKALTITYPKDATKDLEIKKINRDESYRKVVKDFVATPGPGTGRIFDDPAAIDIVKANLNKIKKQRNNKPFFEWSEDSDWYRKLRKELNPNTKTGTNRDYTNKLINQVVDEFFPGAYHGKNAIKNFRNDTVVKSFIQHLKSVGEFDGQEKFDKVLEQFKSPPKKGTPNNYEGINKSWKAWIAGEFEVEGVDRAQLKKELKARGINYNETIGKWTASAAQLRGKDKIEELTTLNKLNRFTNKSVNEIKALFLKEHPDANFNLRVNELTQLKRNGVYVSGANTELPVTGIEKGDRANWLKKAYGKQFAGNYSKIINAADKLNDPNFEGGKFYDPKKAERLYKAADKFFGPTGIVRKSAVGEAEHALARSFDFLNPDRQLAINSIVDGDLNQFKKNLFDIPVKQYVDEYNKEGTTNARKKELKNLIENRKKTMNALTGGQKSGIVAGDIVSFQYGDKIKPTSSVKAIDVLFDEGKFDIDEYIAKGNAYGEALKKTGLNIDTASSNKIIGEDQLTEIESYITDRTGKVKQPMLPSGLAGAYEMLSDDLKAIVDSEGFKKFSNSKTGKTLSMAAKTPGKLFGIGDVLLGYLDYTNNEPMMSKAKAYQSMLQAMSFGIYKGGDEQNLKEIKQKFIANGGDGEIFDQVVDLNKSNFDMMEYIENIKRSYKDLSGAGYEDIAKKQMKSALNNVKTMGEKNLDKFEQYKTDLAVSEAGSPIQIKDVMQPAKDVKKAAFDLFEEEQIKNYPTTSKQVNTESGPIAEKIYNSILTKDSYKKLLPQNWLSTFNQMIPFMPFKPVTEKEKQAALIKNMEPRERYLYNLARGEDPDNPMTISETANFMDKNKKAIGFAEGGITGLRSKYEYKK
jgi:hypothetical protein